MQVMYVPSLFPLGILAGLALAAALLSRWGWRWKLETITQTCRKCGYDVSKRPDGVDRCSECGSDLTAARGTTQTRRRPNWWLAAPAGLGLIVLLGLIALFAAAFPWVAWSSAKAPITFVAWMARHHSGALGDQYRAAWLSRGGETSAAFYDGLLDLYAGPDAPWAGPWDDVIERALRNGRLSQAQRDRLATEAFKPPTFQVRSPVRQGDPLEIGVTASLRTGANSGARKMDYANFESQAWCAACAGGPAVIGDRDWVMGRVSGNYDFSIPAKEWDPDVKPGRHLVNIVLARELSTGDYPAKALSKRIEQRGQVEVEVLPAGTSIGTPIVAPKEGRAIAATISVHVYHWHDGRIFGSVELFPASVDRAFLIYAVVDGVEKRIGAVAAKAGQGASSGDRYIPVSVSRAKVTDRLTIVLVGDGEALKHTLHQTGYWRGRIEFPDVSLQPWKDWAPDMNRMHKPTTWPHVISR